jgi:hypothetical protein
MEARVIAKLLRLWKIGCWHSNATNRMDWQRIAMAAVLALWASLIFIIDLPLLAETRQINGQVAKQRTLDSARQRSPSAQPAPYDPTHTFIASLPAFDKCADQLRALNELAEKSGVSIASVHYRYEPLPGLPITKVAMSVDARGEEQQHRRFLQMALNTFQNLAIARLVSTRSADGASSPRMKLDINLYFRDLPGPAA